ncbi:hypothetical protein ABEB36_010857 [Hypothenemus hampei]|uniref:SSD domain-containing protein n=1 Tax=Hypothenemus hampei TaxID=57062 RepID=A0ABD1EDA0_HYPHA
MENVPEPKRKMNYKRCYINALINHPYIILLFIGVFSSICLIIPFIVKNVNIPNFQDPQLGFSTRNTIISNRLTTWQNLQNDVRPSGSLTKNPKEFLISKHLINVTMPSYDPIIKRKGMRRKDSKNGTRYRHQNYVEDVKNETTVYGKVITNEKKLKERPGDLNKWQALQNMSDYNGGSKKITYEKYFCGDPDENYVHLVISSTKKENLFTYKYLKSLCKLELFLMSFKSVSGICISNSQIEGQCCKPWSLPNYIAALFDRHTCLTITESDVNETRTLLAKCSMYFYENKLSMGGLRSRDSKVPLECIKHNAVFNILNYLTSTTFSHPQDFLNETVQDLDETVLFLPVATSLASLPLYFEVESLNDEFENLSIVAMNFGIKSILFDEYLLRDSWLMGLGALFVFICVWIYTTSIFLTAMTIISILFVVIVTYFIYEVVYEISFFPFMNVLTVVICIGIGADNIFILCKFWHINKLDQSHNNNLKKIISKTMRHAFKSMFVTTLTTAVAFWGSIVSTVTAISCFSLFSGTAIIILFLLTVTWAPACLVIWEQTCLSKWSCPFSSARSQIYFYQPGCSFLKKSQKWLNSTLLGRKDLVLKAILHLRYFWIVFFTSLTLASAYVAFVNPGLTLPDTLDFQLFRSYHPFEKYDFLYKNKFWFQRKKYELNEYKMPLRFVWGVHPVDNGDHLNPVNLGTLVFDPTFDMVDQAAQLWLNEFCTNIQYQPFSSSSLGLSLTSCFIHTFSNSMNRRCFDEFSKKDKKPCCNASPFPFEKSVFNTCIIEEMAETFNGPVEFTYPKTAGAMFSKEDEPKIKAVVVEFESDITFSLSYKEMHEFYVRVNDWTKSQLETAPLSMRNGFFISDLNFYDLQKELIRGTKISIVVSMVLASIVLILSTLNPLLTFLAIVTITFSIITTIGCLVLLGWTLNITESVAISTAIGLTVDFSLHYCINYRLCPTEFTKNRIDASKYALSCLMGPSFMAALTTAGAGFFMMFSLVLPYFQIGLFLVLVMTISWSYATFFLGSLLISVGPVQNACQYSYTMFFHRINKSRRQENETVVSTSSTAELDSEIFLRRNTPMSLKKRSSFTEPYVQYTPNQGLSDQSPSSNVTIIMGEGKPLV